MLKLVCCLIASFYVFDVSNDSPLYIVKKKYSKFLKKKVLYFLKKYKKYYV